MLSKLKSGTMSVKPNIIILTIDALREDKIYGENKKSYTPNIDSLIKNGTYFSHAISTSDQTGTSLTSLFSGRFPTTSGKTQFNFDKKTWTFFDALKQDGYNIHSFIPDHDFFITLTSKFNENTIYEFKEKEKWLRLQGGLGNQIVEQLKSNKMKNPWIYYIHLMDIRSPFQVPPEFDNSKYGENNYEKLVSYVDTWIGKFLQHVNLDETIIVLTSDHGEYIPITGQNINEIPKIQKIITNSTKKIPFLEKIGMKVLLNARFAAQTYRKEKLKRELTPYEMRSFNSRATLYLYDETIRVPLLYVGHKIKKDMIIQDMVRHVDVFTTIMEMIDSSTDESKIDGRSLLPLIKGEKIDEKPTYIEVGINLSQLINNKKSDGLSKVIGIRTSEYKYFRPRDHTIKNIYLFDLKKDPLEENNIAQSNPDIVKTMEDILTNFINKGNKNKSSTLTAEEIKKAKDILLKIGYI
jgi:arylsulfatase A-like enzyme